MSKMKWASALVVGIFLTNSGAHAADLPGEQFVASKPPTNDRYTGIKFAVDENDKNIISSLEAFTSDGTSRNSRLLTRQVCNKIGDQGCETSKYFQYSSLLSLCTDSSASDCVRSVTATDAAGNTVEGKFVENYPGTTRYTYVGDRSIDLPPGDSSFIVDFPAFPHQGGSKYLVLVNLFGYRGFGDSKFTLEDFTTSIYAVSKVDGPYQSSRPETIVRPDFILAGRSRSGGGSSNIACVQSNGTSCLISWPLPLNVDFGLTLKLHTKVTGWIHGRMADAQADISKAADSDQLFTLKGKPSLVPGLFAWFKKSELPKPIADFYGVGIEKDASGSGFPGNDGTSSGPDGLPWSILKTALPYDDRGISEFRAWIDSVGDKATYAPTIWAARAIQSGTQFAECMKGQEALSGIVTTNSTMYVGAPPTFNKAEGSLDYKVSSPHYLPDGTEFKGMYNLIIKSDVARCIYGFTNAPVSATISIVAADGTNQVATTLFGERDGWMYLKANNFTFSTPILKVKLTQVAETPIIVPAPTATPAAKPVATKKTTITCVKGKTSKKVTAAQPKCPTGYKKK
jgi:hypothetical protein